MARKLRFVVPRIPVHATARGVNRCPLFRSGFDKAKYLRALLGTGPNFPAACYDIENRPTCSTPYTYAIGYAPDNKRIWEGAAYNDPGTGHDFSEDRFTLYGLDGQRVGIYRIRNRMSPPDTINMRFVTMEENVWVGKKLLKTRKGTSTEVVLQDRLGSVLFRYNANNDTKKAYAYYPYGQSRGVNTPDNEDGFGTYTRLDNNENHYADQRYYNAKNGRFHQPDPYQASGGSEEPGSWNRYSYVEGDPINKADPRGLYSCFTNWGVNVCGDHVDPILTLAGQCGDLARRFGDLGQPDPSLWHFGRNAVGERQKRR